MGDTKPCLSLIIITACLSALVTLVHAQGIDNQYCRITRKHTMCSPEGYGRTCAQPLSHGITRQDKQNIVQLHNEYRMRIANGQEARGRPGPQPPAADMEEMVWDEELALVAQRHADQCKFAHECARCRAVGRFNVGQNLYLYMQTLKRPRTNWQRAITDWYLEVALFSKNSVKPFRFNKPAGHYTAMVWSNTNRVGCGMTEYKKGKWYTKIYTCDYGPAGNYINGEMYKQGKACSRCPRGTSCSPRYPGLCASRFGTSPSIDSNVLGTFSGVGTSTKATPSSLVTFRPPLTSTKATPSSLVTFRPPLTSNALTTTTRRTTRRTTTTPNPVFTTSSPFTLTNVPTTITIIPTSTSVAARNNRSTTRSIPTITTTTPAVFTTTTINSMFSKPSSTTPLPTSIKVTHEPTTEPTPGKQSQMFSCKFSEPSNCKVKVSGKKWTTASRGSSSNIYYQTELQNGEQTEMVVGNPIPPPKSQGGTACLTFHYQKIVNGAQKTPLQVYVWPLEGNPGKVDIMANSEHGASWIKAEVTFRKLDTTFFIMFKARTALGTSVKLALDNVAVTEGYC